MTWAHALLVFFAALAADITWAYWVIHTAAHRPLRASLWAVAIILLGAVNIDALILSRWYVIPAALGAGVGTFWAIYVDRYLKDRNARN